MQSIPCHGTNTKNSGFSLVEILVALLIFSLVIGAVYGVFQSQNYAYSIQGQMTEMEQNVRAAMNMVLREVRMAGYHANGPAFVNNLSSFVPSSWIPSSPLSVNLDANPKITAGTGTIPDMITFLSVLDTDNNPTTLSTATTAGATQLTIAISASLAGYAVGDMLHIGTGSEYAKIVGIPESNKLNIDTNPSVVGNQGLQEAYAAGTAIGEISMVTYAVIDDGDKPVLKRRVNGGSYQPVAEHITDMQIASLGSGEIQLTIAGRTEKPDTKFTLNNGYRTMTLDARIKVRNADAIATGSSCLIPAAPVNLSILDGLNTTYPCHIYMTWDDVTTDVNGDPLETGCELSGYRIYFDTVAGAYGYSVDVGVTDNNGYALDVSALKSCIYYVSAAALNSGGLSAKSSELSMTDAVAPAAPTGVNATGTASDNRVDLSWNYNLECDIAGYHVYRATTAGGPYTQVTSQHLGPETVIYSNSPVKGCTTYYYVVSAQDSCPNVSLYSGEVSATTTDSTPPQPPTNLTHTAAAGVDILSWTVSYDDGDGANDVVSYKVYGDGNLLATLSAGSTTYSYTPPSPPVLEYEVTAVDAYCGNESEPAQVTTCDDPPSVAITSHTNNEVVSGTITMTGTASANGGATLAGVQIRIGSGSWEGVSGADTWSFIWDTTTVPNGLYVMTVKATDDGGCFDDATVALLVDNIEPAPSDFLVVNLYTCKQNGNKPLYMVVQVTNENGDPVTGATVKAYVGLNEATLVNTGTNRLDEIGGVLSGNGIYGGNQSPACSALKNLGGQIFPSSVPGLGGVAAKTSSSYLNVELRIEVEAEGYEMGVTQFTVWVN